MINLTDAAIHEIKRLMQEKGQGQGMVRFGVETGGCSGLQYSLDFDHRTNANDQIFEQGGLKIVCDEESLTYLDGLQVDFSDKLMGGGFKFSNPNASRSCGCGTSYRTRCRSSGETRAGAPTRTLRHLWPRTATRPWASHRRSSPGWTGRRWSV